MAFRSAQVAVNDSRDVVAASDPGGMCVRLRNHGTNDVFIGDDTVTTATGYKLPPGGPPEDFELYEGEPIHGIAAAGQSGVVHVVKTGAL